MNSPLRPDHADLPLLTVIFRAVKAAHGAADRRGYWRALEPSLVSHRTGRSGLARRIGNAHSCRIADVALAHAYAPISIGRPGSALDNAVIESWHSTLEFELRAVEHFATKQAARAKVAAWIEDYNTHCRHSACQMMSPVSYERALNAGQAA
jgi:transposase InsO family protein